MYMNMYLDRYKHTDRHRYSEFKVSLIGSV